MLVLGVRSGEYITIGQDIVIQVAVQAPRECPVVRGKLVESSGGAPDCIRKLRQKKTPPHTSRFKQDRDETGALSE